jgi:hypothetical protein
MGEDLMSTVARLGNFQGYRQALETWCWAAVASSVARYYQAEAGEDEILPQCHYIGVQHPGRSCRVDRPFGTKLKFDDADCARKGCAVRDGREVGRARFALADPLMPVFKSLRTSAVGMGEIVAEIDAERPVVIRVRRGPDWYHLLVVCGYDLSVPALRIWDPAMGERVVSYARLTTIYGDWTHTVFTTQPPTPPSV